MADDGRREDHSNKFDLLDMKFSSKTTQSSEPRDNNDSIILIAVAVVIVVIIAAMVGGILRAWTLERRAVQLPEQRQQSVEIEMQPLQHVEEMGVVCDSRMPMVLGPRSIRDRKHFAKIPHKNFTQMTRPKVYHRKNRMVKKE